MTRFFSLSLVVALAGVAVAAQQQPRGIAFTDFTAADVVRHPLVARIIDAYDKDAEANPPAK